MNKQTHAFTGHRDLRAQDVPYIKDKLKENLQKLNVKSLLVGNADGADQIAIELAEELAIKITLLSEAVPQCSDSTDYYAAQAEYIAENCDHIITVWDGIFTGKPGGTSDIVHRALKSNRPLQLYQLVCPRESNPYPVANLLAKVIDFENEKFSRIPFAVPFSWIHYEHHPVRELVQRSSRSWAKLPFAVKLPGILLFLTLFFGLLGFSELHGYCPFLNNFFRAVNLVTLNSSVFENQKTTPILEVARILGLMTASYTIFLAFYGATENIRKNSLIKKWMKKKKPFSLILGLNQKSFDLTKDLLQSSKSKIVIMHSEEQNKYLQELKLHPQVVTIHGNLSSRSMLSEIFAHKAERVYIMSDIDSENIRASQELDILDREINTDKIDRFVHLEDEGKRRFLHNSLSKKGQNRTNIFNIYENTVRRLLLYYPTDRFYLNPTTKTINVVILGFDKLGRQITLTLLKQGHYSRDKHLRIIVYCANAPAEEARFLSENQQFKSSGFAASESDLDIYNYTWRNIRLQFVELPVSDTEWLQEDNRIFTSINSNEILNLYACHTDGIQSATCLDLILPKIDYLKKKRGADVQIFCYYNFPDKKEEDIVEEYFNKIAPNTFVRCFGNYCEECSASAIQGMSLDAFPMLFNAGYHSDHYAITEDPKALWKGLSEKGKVSNRQAADHLWTKIRLAWPKINWNFDPDTFRPDEETDKIIFGENMLDEYGEIEHRRWCADLLLQGFAPFPDPYNSPGYVEKANRWEYDADYKNISQVQKKHISLVPYRYLTPKNQEKDKKQIKLIPIFLQRVINTKPNN